MSLKNNQLKNEINLIGAYIHILNDYTIEN